MLSVARLVPGLLAGWLTACTPSVDYGETHYRCDQSGTCPDGFSCIAGECVTGVPRPDAAGDDDDRPDARVGDEITMLHSSSSPNLVIPDGDDSGVADEIDFDGFCSIVDLTVDVAITHDWPPDLAVWLTSPWNTDVLLHEVGADGGAEGIVGTYPTTLTPEDSLEAFVGEDGAADWQLWVADVSSGDVGTLHAWALTLWCE
jgi:subtilisin-like proprotein convertase family protein